jgi:hypothetical protein
MGTDKVQLRETVTTIKTPVSARDPLVMAVMRSLEEANISQLPYDLEALPGMSGKKYRRFINRLVGRLPGPRYLEVGVHSGSTLCAAIHGNDVDAVGIDNFELRYLVEDPNRQMIISADILGDPLKHLDRNLAQFQGRARVSIIQKDFREVDIMEFRPFDVYLFDGPHEEKDQYDGLVMALPAMADKFVYIVDDWNWEQVRKGTLTAIQDCELDWLLGLEIFTQVINMETDQAILEQAAYSNKHFFQNSDWHNGYFIGVFTKGGPK